MDSQDTIDVLNTLIETCNDGERGFRHVAEHAKNPELRSLFMERAKRRRSPVRGEHLPGIPGITGSTHSTQEPV